MKKLMPLMLIFALIAGFGGCGASQPTKSEKTAVSADYESPSAVEATTNPVEVSEAPTPSPTPEPITFQWDGIELVLESITDDVEARTDIDAPTGKYVVVTFTISSGDLIVDHVIGVFQDHFMLTCGGETYHAVTFSTEHIERIEEDTFLHSPGPLHIYFDLPVDADISSAVVAVTDLT